LTFVEEVYDEELDNTILRFSYPEQDLDNSKWGKVVALSREIVGQVLHIDEENFTLDILITNGNLATLPEAIVQYNFVPTGNKQSAIIEFGEWIISNGFDSKDNTYRAARDLLLREKPRLKTSIQEKDNALSRLIQMATFLDHSVLPVQGPPGAGKSYSASKMILDLVDEGYKIGITAMSHKVITNVLDNIYNDALSGNKVINIYQKAAEVPEVQLPNWKITDGNLSKKAMNIANVIAGTSFMWCKTDMKNTVDYLIVDEAGQLSLSDTLATAGSAKNLVLMGDPQQLKQPIQGTHPEGTEVSALEHILGEAETIAEDRGILLNKSYRMYPSICQLDSDLFYESKLEADEANKNINIQGPFLNAPGLYHAFIEHYNNVSKSDEEASMIYQIIEKLCDGKTTYTDNKGTQRIGTMNDIMVITPYNAQKIAINKLLPDLKVGTVDKFQGQEAPIVICSMATSSQQDAPRGMDFLYSRNRFNVALSRAQGAFILIASKALIEPECKTPHQIKLANAFCLYAEVSTPLLIENL